MEISDRNHITVPMETYLHNQFHWVTEILKNKIKSTD